MKDRHVPHSSQVLLALLGGDMNVNQIIKQTSLYKDYAREAIKLLHEAKLIEEENKRYIQGQEKKKRLTELGWELATLQDETINFLKYFIVLQKEVQKINNLTLKDPKVVGSILKNQQWTQNDIDNYPEWAENAQRLFGSTASLLYDGLIIRYAKIISKFTLNEIARSMLVRIVTDTMSEYLLSTHMKRRSCVRCGATNIDESHIFEEFSPRIFDLVGDLDLTNKFAEKEIKNFIKSSILMLAPQRNYIEKMLEMENDLIKQMPDEPNTLSKSRVSFYDEILKSVP